MRLSRVAWRLLVMLPQLPRLVWRMNHYREHLRRAEDKSKGERLDRLRHPEKYRLK